MPKSRAPSPPAERPPERARGRGARPVSELVGQVGGVAFRRFGFVQSAVVTRWPEIVGERFAQASAPESIRFPRGKKEGGTLHLVAHGAHAPMLLHVGPEIVERVNRFFGYPAVARVAIRQGVAPPPRHTVAPPREMAPMPTEMGDSLKQVGDPELKAVLTALARGVATPPAPVRSIPIMGKIS